MQIEGLIKCYSFIFQPSPILAQLSFPFNPVKLILLVVWFYLCLYIVQRFQFNPLVPKNTRSIFNLTAVFAGPIILLLLVILDVLKKLLAGTASFTEIVTQQVRDLASSAKSSGLLKTMGASKITLLDSSGSELKEIYGAGKKTKGKNPVLKLTEDIIWTAMNDRASDILIDPKDSEHYTVRFRIDGVLRVAYEIKSGVCQAVINSVKAVSNMDIAERRRPQDGSFIARTDDGTTSFRVASAGVRNGEKLSVRVLSRDASLFTLESIGLSSKQSDIIKQAIDRPSGMILMCGPTGSGKTTTLYAMLNEIDLHTRNVITVEDPVEYVLKNASQIEVNPKADITFAKALRSILRQDPDVICVGEIRDEETASIALRASQTGHLVMATIHCNDNASAMVRLLDLDVTPIMMSSGLSLIIAQRLLRKLCDNCKLPARLSEKQIENFRRKKINYKNICRPVGCGQCENTGFLGRVAVCDILTIDDDLKAKIADGNLSVSELKINGNKDGAAKLRKEGMKLVLTGVTSFDEVKRVIGQ
ncbi:GspE/PulE family protein [Planctomycetota bacterium]